MVRACRSRFVASKIDASAADPEPPYPKPTRDALPRVSAHTTRHDSTTGAANAPTAACKVEEKKQTE